MNRKFFVIILIFSLTLPTKAGATLFEANETISSKVNDGLLDLSIPFDFEPNKDSIYQINFTNLVSSDSTLELSYSEHSSDFLLSNTSQNNDGKFILPPGEVLSLSYEKQSCELDTVITRNTMIKLLNQSSATIDIKATVIKDTGECSASDGFLPYPFMGTIFSIWILATIMKKSKTNKIKS